MSDLSSQEDLTPILAPEWRAPRGLLGGEVEWLFQHLGDEGCDRRPL